MLSEQTLNTIANINQEQEIERLSILKKDHESVKLIESTMKDEGKLHLYRNEIDTILKNLIHRKRFQYTG